MEREEDGAPEAMLHGAEPAAAVAESAALRRRARRRLRHRKPPWPRRSAEGALRGAVGAMAMTGLRELTRNAGLLEEPPPEAFARQRLRLGRGRRTLRGRERAAVELLHWGYGALAGTVFALLPSVLRRRALAGPAYGVAVWSGFELAVAPALGLARRRKRPVSDRLALLADHALYGAIVSGLPGAPPRRRRRRRGGRRASATASPPRPAPSPLARGEAPAEPPGS